jgi:hypothetical protein
MKSSFLFVEKIIHINNWYKITSSFHFRFSQVVLLVNKSQYENWIIGRKRKNKKISRFTEEATIHFELKTSSFFS